MHSTQQPPVHLINLGKLGIWLFPTTAQHPQARDSLDIIRKGSTMPKFGDLESAIMTEVWQADGPLLVREILDRLDRGLAYNTVQTVTEILNRKGWLEKERDGRAFRYAAAATQGDYVTGLIQEALSFSDDRAAALVGFVETMPSDEADELHQLLAKARADSANP
jgi:predicted transcriptional regulator